MASDEKRSAVEDVFQRAEYGEDDLGVLLTNAREELRALRQSASDAYHRNQGVEIQNAALRAENAAMREALEKIASETAATWVCDTARAALGGRDE